MFDWKKYSVILLILCGLALSGGCGRARSAQHVRSIQDLDRPRYRIGGMTGSVALREAQTRLPRAKYLEYAMPIDAFTALCAGKLDAVVLDRPTLNFMAIAHPELAVMSEDLAVGHISVAAAKNNRALIRRVNRFIRQYRADGTYAKMFDRWFRTQEPEMPRLPKAPWLSRKLKVGITANNEPMCFMQEEELAGFDTEFSLRLGAALKRRVVFKDIPYEALPAALESGKIDLAIAQMDALPEREESLCFSDNYIDSPITFLLRQELYAASREDSGAIKTFDDLAGKKIGTLTGTSFDLIAKKWLPPFKLMSFSQMSQEIAALESGKIDAFFIDEPVGRLLLLQRQDFRALAQKLPCENCAFCFPRESERICGQISEEIRRMKQDGTLKKLQEQWFSLDETKQELPVQKSFDRTLTFAAVPDVPPFAFFRHGKVVGYDVHVAILAANRLGYALKVIATDFSSIVECVKTGKCDFAGSGLNMTKERQESVLFCEPDYNGSISLIVRDRVPQQKASGMRAWYRRTAASLKSSFVKTFIRESRWKLILKGLGITLFITFFSVLLGSILAFPVCMMSRSQHRLISWLCNRFVSLIMGTPILVTLMILYYVVFARVDINGAFVAILAFGLDFAACTSITLRSGIEGVPRGQTEAALALGYTPLAAFLEFVLPQAVRTILPVYRSEIISTLKATSIVGYIAIMDLTKMGDIIRSRTYEAFFPLIAIAAIYFLAAKLLTSILVLLEKRVDPDSRRNRLMPGGSK